MRELSIYAYEDWPDLYVFRCSSCGSTGPEGSECGGHDAPPVMNQDSLSVKRVRVKVCQDDEQPIRNERLDDLLDEVAPVMDEGISPEVEARKA